MSIHTLDTGRVPGAETVHGASMEQGSIELWPLQEEHADDRLIRSERMDEEHYSACFTLQLAASVAGTGQISEPPVFDSFLLEQALSAIDPGQQVRFVFRRNAEGADAVQAAFLVEGRAIGPDDATAHASARALHDALSRLLAARNDCRFTPVAKADSGFAHRFRVEAEGILMTSQIKPTLFNRAPLPVILPAPSLVEARVPFWNALLGCNFAVETTVILRPVRLDDAQLKAIADTLGMLGDTDLRYEHYPDHRPLSRDQVRLQDDWFKPELVRWLRLASGMELEIEFATPEPLSAVALRWLAQTLLPARRIRVQPIGELAPVSVNAVDLRACLNEAKVMPALLPSQDIVERLGLPQNFPLPRSSLASEGIVLGRTANRTIHLPDLDRDRHCYIVGATGSGKSTLLRNMIRQDIAAGEGVCLIDPHGDLYQDALESIPAERANDVILINPGEFDRAVGLNYLEVPGIHPAVERNLVANEMMKIFDRLYNMQITGGPLFESYARNGLLLLMENNIPGLTLLEFPLIFEDDGFRKHLIKACTNPTVARFWSKQAARAAGEVSLENVTPYITSKFNQFTSNVLMRNIVGQSRSTVNFREAMDGRKIVLVNLSKGLLGEFDSALLGSLIVSKLFIAVLGRSGMSREERNPYYLYIDEFQNFTTDTIAHLLSESRKYGLRLTLANQHLTQINVGTGAGNIAASVLANVGSILAMRLGASDSEALKGILGRKLEPRIMQNLPDFHAAARLIQEGRPTDAFVFQTLPPATQEKNLKVQRIIRQSNRWKYTRPAAEVEQEIARRQTGMQT